MPVADEPNFPRKQASNARQKVARVVLLWALLGGMLLLGLAFARGVQASADAELTAESVVAGPLSVRLPEGWVVKDYASTDRVDLIASDPDEVAFAAVRLVQVEPGLSPAQVLEQVYLRRTAGVVPLGGFGPAEQIESPRPAPVGEFDGATTTLAFVAKDAGLLAYTEVVAAPVADRWAVVVEVSAYNEDGPDGRALALAIARSVKVRR